MLAYVAKAEGSVSSTVVVDGTDLPQDPQLIVPYLAQLRERMGEGDELMTKYAVITPSSHPMYDLNYTFFQYVPSTCMFDYKGSCGHSILASICVAMKWGWIHSASPGLRVRVYIRNIGDTLVCEVDQASRKRIHCTAHFIEAPGTRLRGLLPTGQTKQPFATSYGIVHGSIVSAGNPYVFVSCAELGMGSEQELFESNSELFSRLQDIRAAAASILGWEASGVFPKIAAIGVFQPNILSVRAISVPSWHPTLALTGAACLGAAASIGGTVVEEAVRSFADKSGLKIQTKNGSTAVSTVSTGNGLDDLLLYNSISDKTVEFIGPVKFREEEGQQWKQLWQKVPV